MTATKLISPSVATFISLMVESGCDLYSSEENQSFVYDCFKRACRAYNSGRQLKKNSSDTVSGALEYMYDNHRSEFNQFAIGAKITEKIKNKINGRFGPTTIEMIDEIMCMVEDFIFYPE